MSIVLSSFVLSQSIFNQHNRKLDFLPFIDVFIVVYTNYIFLFLHCRPESQIIQIVVGELWHKLSYAFSEYTENLVGIISRAEKLESCLDLGSNNVRMVGIWGMGGIGIWVTLGFDLIFLI